MREIVTIQVGRDPRTKKVVSLRQPPADLGVADNVTFLPPTHDPEADTWAAFEPHAPLHVIPPRMEPGRSVAPQLIAGMVVLAVVAGCLWWAS